MNTPTSTVFHSGSLIPHRTHKAIKNSYATTIFTKICLIAERFVHTIDRAASGSSEKFNQDHVTAIFMAVYAEVALGPIMGALAIYFYSN